MTYGYVRPSALASAEELGAKIRQAAPNIESVFTEEAGDDLTHLPAFDNLVRGLVEGDKVVVADLSQFGRSVGSMVDALTAIRDAGGEVVAVEEDYGSKADGPSIFIIAQMLKEAARKGERERRASILENARGRRTRVLGRPSVDEDKLQQAIALYKRGDKPVREITEETGVARSVLYRALSKQGIERN